LAAPGRRPAKPHHAAPPTAWFKQVRLDSPSEEHAAGRELSAQAYVSSDDTAAVEYVNEPPGSHTHRARGGLVPIRGVPLVAIRGRIVAVVGIPGLRPTSLQDRRQRPNPDVEFRRLAGVGMKESCQTCRRIVRLDPAEHRHQTHRRYAFQLIVLRPAPMRVGNRRVSAEPPQD
jgi:hypothetical protein